jgi:uncharacterized protein YqiB (DUF1249 family)
MTNQSKKYHPKLSTLMNLCEINYMLLIRLLASSNNDEDVIGNERDFFISDFLAYNIKTLEITRYTSLISICQEMPNAKQAKTGQDENLSKENNKGLFSSILHPKMTIRLYHDARMAEVISNQDIRQVKPRYDYPNSKMHLPDEKEQINQFLKEWLQLCLKLGQVNLSLFE